MGIYLSLKICGKRGVGVGRGKVMVFGSLSHEEMEPVSSPCLCAWLCDLLWPAGHEQSDAAEA